MEPLHQPMPPDRRRLAEVTLLAVRLGFTAFGGPAAHIALLRDEVVTRRRWITDAEFLDLLGATNLIPGPNSTEMVMHVGYRRAGISGLLAAGIGFILPAALIVLGFAVAYVRLGHLPATDWLLYGIKPVIIAIVLQALWNLGKSAARKPMEIIFAAGSAILFAFGVNELILLFGSGAIAIALRRAVSPGSTAIALPLIANAATVATATFAKGTTLFLLFLKIGAVLYGSGYVLLAFLRRDFVIRREWLTDSQLLDAVAVGQFTPGPVFTTATFVGYLVGGFGGAVLATVGVFLPAFVFVALLHPLIPRMRRSRLFAAFLDGVNAAAVGLLAAIAVELGRAAIFDLTTALIAVISAILILTLRLNSVWLVLGGAGAGIVLHLVS